QLCDSARNAVLVVPQGPYDAPDSFDGKLEDPGGFKQFVDDVLAELRRSEVLKRNDFKLGRVILSGHSGGYQVISSILDCGGLIEPIKEVWLFDALYAQTPKFMNWADHHAGRFIVLYTDHGGTLQETQKLMNDLKVREAPFFSGEEEQVTASELERERLILLHSNLPHDDVLDKHRTFQRFLETSCLEKR
ncbi:MAG TPA: hypothetical protein VG897_10585, partial [Terriglobales bacterium]|nr:hypothetical protein [Terriglobales bacterium]